MRHSKPPLPLALAHGHLQEEVKPGDSKGILCKECKGWFVKKPEGYQAPAPPRSWADDL